MDFNTLTTTLTNFVRVFDGAGARLTPIVNGLLAALLGIEVVLMGLWWALDGGDRIANVFKKILFFGFWIWLSTGFTSIAKAFVDSLVKAGLVAGGSARGQDLLLDPSRIAGYGLNATDNLQKALENVGFDIIDAIIFGLGYVAIMVAFLIIAIQVFLAVLEYYLVLAVASVLIPFGVSPYTRFIADKAIGATVSAGIKLMVLAFVLAVVDPVLAQIRFASPDISFNELWSVILTIGAITFLSWRAPGLAAGMLAGSPSLGASDASQNVSAGTAIVGGLAAGAVSATRAAAGALGMASPSAPKTTAAASTPGDGRKE